MVRLFLLPECRNFPSGLANVQLIEALSKFSFKLFGKLLNLLRSFQTICLPLLCTKAGNVFLLLEVSNSRGW